MLKIKKCSFCGNELNNQNKGIEGIEAVICYQCLDFYNEVEKISESRKISPKIKDISPKKIYQELSKSVIGQEEAKKILSVALYRHYKRLFDDGTLAKANVLLIGPTGVGKTLLAKKMAEILDIPIAICDATVYTQAGYVGEDVENILLKLLHNADFNLEKAEHGIVFLDEFDKLARKSENPSITRDVSGEGVQNSLLKIIEGNVVNVPKNGGRKHPYHDYIAFDTSKVLFICAGAFDGLDSKKMANVGFEKNNYVEDDNLIISLKKYGIIPELLGRLPVIARLNKLKQKDLEKILKESDESLIKEYQHLFASDEVTLEFSDDAVSEIARLAIDTNLGARSLKKILEKTMLDYLFEVPSNKNIKKIYINKEYIEQNI